MNKQEFLRQLRKGLSGLSQDDIEERLTFYSEMIEDGRHSYKDTAINLLAIEPERRGKSIASCWNVNKK